MLAKINLGTKFTLLLSIVCLIGLITSGVVLWRVLEWKARGEVSDQALMLIEAMRSVRGYTDSHIGPALVAHGQEPSTFVAESVPAFSARVVFESFRQYKDYNQFNYKEASLNPTNPRDKADDFESHLIMSMRNDRSIDETSGFRTMDGGSFFYIARPLAISSQRCLDCHSTPDVAPSGLIKTYGSEHGFGWKLNDINSTQIMYVPAEEVFNAALGSFLRVMGIFGISLITLIFLINLLLKRYVIQPVSIMGRLAQKIKNDELLTEDLDSVNMLKLVGRADELGWLSLVFREMAREVHNRTEELKQQVLQLRVEIDERKRQDDLAVIVESDFFKDLQSKARLMRQRRHDDTKASENHSESSLTQSQGS